MSGEHRGAEDGGLRDERLRRTAQRLAAEEVAAVYRHDLTGKLGAARMLLYTLKRRTIGEGAPLAGDARTTETLDHLEAALKSTLAMLERALFAAPPDQHDPVDLGELLTDLIGRDARLVLQVPALPLWVDADADDLSVAVLALVENALAASSVVRVRCAESGDRAVIDVIDGGPGMSEAQQDATPFTTTTPGRLGIGLRIVRRVVRRWGGRFEFLRDGATTVARIELAAIGVRSSEAPHRG